MLSSQNQPLAPGVSGERQESSLLGEFGPSSGLWDFIWSKKSQAVSSSISDLLFMSKDTDTTLCLAVDVGRFAIFQQRGLGRHPKPGMPRANWDPLGFNTSGHEAVG